MAVIPEDAIPLYYSEGSAMSSASGMDGRWGGDGLADDFEKKHSYPWSPPGRTGFFGPIGKMTVESQCLMIFS